MFLFALCLPQQPGNFTTLTVLGRKNMCFVVKKHPMFCLYSQVCNLVTFKRKRQIPASGWWTNDISTGQCLCILWFVVCWAVIIGYIQTLGQTLTPILELCDLTLEICKSGCADFNLAS